MSWYNLKSHPLFWILLSFSLIIGLGLLVSDFDSEFEALTNCQTNPDNADCLERKSMLAGKMPSVAMSGGGL